MKEILKPKKKITIIYLTVILKCLKIFENIRLSIRRRLRLPPISYTKYVEVEERRLRAKFSTEMSEELLKYYGVDIETELQEIMENI